jgi:hypothetical protein
MRELQGIRKNRINEVPPEYMSGVVDFLNDNDETSRKNSLFTRLRKEGVLSLV